MIEEKFEFAFDTGLFTDVVIEIKEIKDDELELVGSLKLNRILLARSSRYFFTMFSNGMKESNDEVVQLCIPCGYYSAMYDLLYYVYHGMFQKYDFEHLVQMLELCDQFEMSVLTKLIDDISWCLSNSDSYTESCAWMKRIDDDVRFERFDDLRKVAMGNILQEFVNLDIVFSDKNVTRDFLNFSVNVVFGILESELITPHSENTVFQCMILWLNHDEERLVHLDKLIDAIRIISCDLNFFHDVIYHHKVLKNSKKCQEIILDTLVYHSLPPRRQISEKHKFPRKYRDNVKGEFSWEIENFLDNQHLSSPRFFIGGYFWFISIQQISALPDHLGAYLMIDIERTGLTAPFSVYSKYELSILSASDNNYHTFLSNSSEWTSHKGWGKSKLFESKNLGDSPYLLDSGSIKINVHIHILSEHNIESLGWDDWDD